MTGTDKSSRVTQAGNTSPGKKFTESTNQNQVAILMMWQDSGNIRNEALSVDRTPVVSVLDFVSLSRTLLR